MIAKLTQEAASSDKVPKQYYHKAFNHMYRLWSYWMSKEPDNYAEIYTNNTGEANAIVELFKKVLDLAILCGFIYHSFLHYCIPIYFFYVLVSSPS